MPTPFYQDWTFWSFVCALTAIALSQLPPLKLLFRRAKLSVEIYNVIHLTHRIGNPNAQLHLVMSNTGGRNIKIRGITITFSRDKQAAFEIGAKNYLELPADKNAILLTSFTLKPGDEWSHAVNFFNVFSRQDEKLIKELEAALWADIRLKRKGLADEVTVTADEKFVTPITEFYKQRFPWYPGEYDMTLSAITDPPNVMVEKKARFTLFESDSKELADYANDYKYGFGLIIPWENHRGIFASLKEN